MNAYIISTIKNLPLAKRIVDDIKYLTITSSSYYDLNTKELTEYTKNTIKKADIIISIIDNWSQKQAKASFVLTVCLCISGFLLILASILLPIIFNTDFVTSIITTIGGSVTEFIAGTALVVYRKSLSQLNHYHEALHEDERFFSSTNLIGKFSTVEMRDNMLQEIIRSEIQMNLMGVTGGEKTKSID